MPDAQEIEALKKALAQAQGELRVLRTERDLLQEQLNRFKRRLFEARSEAAASVQQKDMFFNEAEAEGAKAQPATEEPGDLKALVLEKLGEYKIAARFAQNHVPQLVFEYII